MLNSLIAKVIIGLIVTAFLGGAYWRISNAFSEAAKVPALKEQVKILKQNIEAERQGCLISKQPTKISDDYGKKNSDDLLATCNRLLRECTNNATSGLAYDIEAICKRREIPLRIECQKDRNDLNTSKVWASECLRAKLCN